MRLAWDLQDHLYCNSLLFTLPFNKFISYYRGMCYILSTAKDLSRSNARSFASFRIKGCACLPVNSNALKTTGYSPIVAQ